MQKLQELKFYCPLTIRREPDYDEEYDYSEEYPEIPSSAAAGYADTVQKRLEAYCSDDGKQGLMEYYNREKSVSEKVYSAVPSVTVRDGKLVGMYTCQVHGELNGMELEELRDYLTGQSSDGVGEGFEQREIKTAEYGNIYVSFWNDSDEWSLLTEEELEHQEMEESDTTTSTTSTTTSTSKTTTTTKATTTSTTPKTTTTTKTTTTSTTPATTTTQATQSGSKTSTTSTTPETTTTTTLTTETTTEPTTTSTSATTTGTGKTIPSVPKQDTPNTGDHRSDLLPIVLAGAGIVLIAGVLCFTRKASADDEKK